MKKNGVLCCLMASMVYCGYTQIDFQIDFQYKALDTCALQAYHNVLILVINCQAPKQLNPQSLHLKKKTFDALFHTLFCAFVLFQCPITRTFDLQLQQYLQNHTGSAVFIVNVLPVRTICPYSFCQFIHIFFYTPNIILEQQHPDIAWTFTIAITAVFAKCTLAGIRWLAVLVITQWRQNVLIHFVN